ncbi:uncharacterized protein [Ptychodera flava]|uniref:uncharacterized protein n=1 Tax=Ptychodera flava TaxID=63121 RepID=UPI00396A1BA8
MSSDLRILIKHYIKRLEMSAKRNIIIVVCVFTVFTGIYFMYFNHADAVDILAANKEMMNAKKNYPLKSHQEILHSANSAQRHVAAAAIIITEFGESAAPGNATKEGAATKSGNETKKLPEVAGERANVVMEINEVEIVQEQERVENTVDVNHKVDPQDFDWDKWVFDNDYVSIGDIYTKCDEDGRKLVGKTLLMADKENGGVKSVILFNITWPHEIEYGTIHMSVRYDNMELYSNKFDLCTVDEELFQCPLPAGPMAYKYEVHVPAYVPKGTFYSKAFLVDQDEVEVACGISEFNNL